MNETHLAGSCANRWKSHVNVQKTLLKPFYDAVIGPIVDMLGPQDNELVIVSDAVLCLAPRDAVIEAIRTRTVRSLTTYQLIPSVPEGHHKETRALLVGNPCLNGSKKPPQDSPCA